MFNGLTDLLNSTVIIINTAIASGLNLGLVLAGGGTFSTLPPPPVTVPPAIIEIIPRQRTTPTLLASPAPGASPTPIPSWSSVTDPVPPDVATWCLNHGGSANCFTIPPIASHSTFPTSVTIWCLNHNYNAWCE